MSNDSKVYDAALAERNKPYGDSKGDWVGFSKDEILKLMAGARAGANEETMKAQRQRDILLSGLNRVDDLFEYRFKSKTPEELQTEVKSILDVTTARLRKATGRIPVCAK